MRVVAKQFPTVPMIKMLFRDICLQVVMTTSFLYLLFYYGTTCSKSLMRSNNRIFYILFYFIANFKQVFKMF